MQIFDKRTLRWPAMLVAGLLTFAPALAQDAQAPQKNNFGPRAPQAKQVQQQPGQGQGQPQRAPAPEIVATHGDWKVQCDTATKPGADGQKEKQCAIVQRAQSDKIAKAAVTAIFARLKVKDRAVTQMQVLAPIGIYLPTGVAFEIDGAAIGRAPFKYCLPQICIASLEADDQMLDKFRKGNAANFFIYRSEGAGLPIKISLNGFSAAYTALDNF